MAIPGSPDAYLKAHREWSVLEDWRGTSEMARAALQIHQPGEEVHRVICCECIKPDLSGPADWPCRTYVAIEKATRS